MAESYAHHNDNKRRKKGQNRSKAKRASDKRKMSEMYLEGWPVYAIAEELNMSAVTAYKDLKEITFEWDAETKLNTDQIVKKELKKLDKIECEAWKAWKGLINKQLVGSAKYLQVIFSSLKHRAELLGLLKVNAESVEDIAERVQEFILAIRESGGPNAENPAMREVATESEANEILDGIKTA